MNYLTSYPRSTLMLGQRTQLATKANQEQEPRSVTTEVPLLFATRLDVLKKPHGMEWTPHATVPFTTRKQAKDLHCLAMRLVSAVQDSL
jgi:hypothetical protein